MNTADALSSTDDQRWQNAEVAALASRLSELRTQMEAFEGSFADELERLPPSQQASARNLLHYVSLRRNDLRTTQEELVSLGLSSLGRCEGYVKANVEDVLEILGRMQGRSRGESSSPHASLGYRESRRLMDDRSQRLFGPEPESRGAHIMVTMPTEAAQDYELVHGLLEHGMTCMRINCAHDDPETWSAMIANLRQAEREVGRSCRIAMDLAGPKLRTGPIEPGPQVIKWRPQRDRFGRVNRLARIWMHPSDASGEPPSPADAVLPVEGNWLQRIEAGEHLWLRDARGRLRQLRVVEWMKDGVWIESSRTAYVTPRIAVWQGDPPSGRVDGLAQQAKELGDSTSADSLAASPGEGGDDAHKPLGHVGEVPAIEQLLVLHRGDTLLVTNAEQMGGPARHDDRGELLRPAQIGCTLPSIFSDVQAGERILFDDGKIEGVIRNVMPDHLVVEITRARAKGDRLRADKGINLPDSELQLQSLTEKDRQDLEFIAGNADMVAYSFVRRAEDVELLLAELTRLGGENVGVLLKIENRQACENLARILLAVMHCPAAGVMIARGDLMVECGWQRMAELQEEILWLCEAAHMPVIWATQVLEGLAKRGLPSRAEVTDAAMGVRAECVMLNKGPHIVEAVTTLDDILRRMQDHQVKKRPLLRRLRLAEDLAPIKDA